MYSQQIQQVSNLHKEEENEPRRLINIIDIDGCITESLFPNISDKPQTAAEIELLVNDINENNYNKLFPQFIEYYMTNLHQTFYNFFVTGRKVSHFYRLTEGQLSVLPSGSFMIKYYPEHLEHTKGDYYNWKVNTIGALIHSFSQKETTKRPIVFRIFDDDKTYFRELHNLELPGSFFTTYHIFKAEHWTDIQDYVYAKHYKFGYEEVFLE